MAELTKSRVVRDYLPSDLETVQALHEATGIDYKLPNLESPLFLVKKVVEVDGVIRGVGGLYIQVECYLWLDRTDWGSDREKMEVVEELDTACMDAAWLQGIDCAVMYVPPGLERFADYLVTHCGFERNRDGWVTYGKMTGRSNA